MLVCGNETARPPVLYSTVHDLWHAFVAPCQELCQHDGSTDTGRHTEKRDPREASHMAFFKDRSVNQGIMLADLDILSAADHCRMAHARQYARQAASEAATAAFVQNDLCSPEFHVELSAAYAQDYMEAAVWRGPAQSGHLVHVRSHVP